MLSAAGSIIVAIIIAAIIGARVLIDWEGGCNFLAVAGGSPDITENTLQHVNNVQKSAHLPIIRSSNGSGGAAGGAHGY